MFSIALAVHNVLRWVVLVLALWALYRAYRGWMGERDWQPQDKMAGRLLTISFDIQLLLGLFLAVVSPLIQAAVNDLSTIGESDLIRFFAAEHIPVMMAAWILVHLTSVLSKRAEADVKRHQRAAIGYTVALLMVLLATPWFRPLLPGL
ncbi:MAG: hypothetical protein ACLFWD_00370 [Anaerolineales bacterium]